MSTYDEPFRGDQHSALIDDVSNWLAERSLDETPLEKVLQGCFLRLHGAGIPLSRASLSFRTLHPLFRSVSIRWTRGQELQVTGHQHQTVTNEAWLTSPLFYMLDKQVPKLRRHITGDEALLDFPILEELRDKGMTDYLSYMIPYGDRGVNDSIVDGLNVADGIMGSWATDRESGFTDGHIRALQRIEQRLAVLCKIKTRDQIVRNLLQAYLGKDAGEQVLKGQIQRGDVEAIYSVVWYSDLRNSTNMADAMEPVKFLEILNKYFECSAGAVLDHGGEVLRFVGDAVLAIFPIRDEKKTQEA
ncbi:MAG: adenylate/guanylate cyclase domain-containing protein, partial [Gammaproteobacteria bacterium]|nr:adenylate/guanylate cyclase domain-containing protein [Gammaproteobacteria bacterium]